MIADEPFEAHLDRFGARGAELIDLPLVMPSNTASRDRTDDPDVIARSPERDRVDAAHALPSAMTIVEVGPSDWPDALAAGLPRDPTLCIHE